MISADLSSLKGARPSEYLVRFAFGGAFTALAGWLAHRFGPEFGGLFLAFPAIFPAGASLIEKHEQERKAKAGMHGEVRGRVAASVDAAGASAGAIALGVFAVVVWFGFGRFPSALVIVVATVLWALIAGLMWLLRKSRLFHPKHARRMAAAAHRG